MRYSARLVPFLLLLLVAVCPAEGPDVVVLRREAFRDLSGAIPGRLVRELGRQAFLIAARDELGCVTRDETLGESLEWEGGEAALDWLPRIRSHWSGTSIVQLRDNQREAEIEPLVILHPNLDKRTLYPLLAVTWEKASRGALLDRLREAGLRGEAPGHDPENVPGPEVEALLGRMNFVSQWDAVARAHRAIAARGPSVEWLSVLSRGYAHLGSLIDHHWTGTPEACYARGMLYAERARGLDEESAEAAWLRPYVLAVCGAHSAGLEEVERLEGALGDPPGWAALIDPVCRFDSDRLSVIASEEQPLREAAGWLAVALRRTLGKHQSFHRVARSCLKHSPDAFGA